MDKENAKKILQGVFELLYALQEELETSDELAEVKLRDCPFCGSKPSIFECESAGWVIECEECGTATLGHDTKQEVIDLWNGELE